MAKSNSTQRGSTRTRHARQMLSLAVRIETERKRLFEISAILACLGETLDSECPTDRIDMKRVTDVIGRMVDQAAEDLEPLVLGLPSPVLNGVQGLSPIGINATTFKERGRVCRHTREMQA